MAVEITESGMLITGEHIEVYRWLAIRRMLKLEIETGMVMSRGRSPLAAVKAAGITTARTKRKAYADLDAAMVAAGAESVPLRK